MNTPSARARFSDGTDLPISELPRARNLLATQPAGGFQKNDMKLSKTGSRSQEAPRVRPAARM